MSNIDKQALRESAEKATPDDWKYSAFDFAITDDTSSLVIVRMHGGHLNDEQSALNGAFIAEANPATMLALLDELEAKDSRIGELEVIATDYGIKFQKAQDALKHQSLLHKSQMEAAEKRIAELEAREVVLPSTQDVHPLGPQSAKIFCEFHRSIVNRCADEIRNAGVKVSINGY